MRFLDKEICKKLMKIGCVSNSQFFHTPKSIGPFILLKINQGKNLYWGFGEIPAFNICDFVDQEYQYTKENCCLLNIKPIDLVSSNDWVHLLLKELDKYKI